MGTATVGHMAKDRVGYCCTECGWTSPKWVGQCRECHAWGTLEETAGGAQAPAVPAALTPRHPALPMTRVDAEVARSRPTGLGELDRVLGGGIVPGAVILLAGEPGVGKSTLLLEVAATAARSGSLIVASPSIALISLIARLPLQVP